MGEGTCVVAPHLRARLYDYAAAHRGQLYILDDEPWDWYLHFLWVSSPLIADEQSGRHFSVIFDHRGLRFVVDCDV